MLVVPCDRSIDDIDLVFGLAHAVPLARITHHDRLDAGVLQRNVVLLRLGNRHVVVVLAMHEHDRRLYFRDVAQRRALPQEVGEQLRRGRRRRLPLLVREHPEFDRQVVVVVRACRLKLTRFAMPAVGTATLNLLVCVISQSVSWPP